MSNMVNKLKYNVDDVVTLKNGENAIIVDMVDGGHYRVKSDSGLLTVTEDEIQNEQLAESSGAFDYANYEEVDIRDIETVKELCNYLIPNKTVIWNKSIVAPVVDVFKRFEPKNYDYRDNTPYYAKFDSGIKSTLTDLLKLFKENKDEGLFIEKDEYKKLLPKGPEEDGSKYIDFEENDDEEENLTEGKLMQYAKNFFKKIKSKKELKEGLQVNDMEYLVSPYVSVDEYTSKIDQDDITIAFFCNEKEVANDLRDFIEKMYYMEIRDIELSDSLTEDNKYILFVELPRNPQFPKILVDVLDSIGFLINKEIKDWQFITLNMNNKEPVSIENIRKFVRLSPVNIDKEDLKIDVKEKSVKESVEDTSINREEYEEGYAEGQDWLESGGRIEIYDNDEVSDDWWQGFCDGWRDAKKGINKFDIIKKESVEYSKGNITRKYIDEGYVTEEEMNKIIDESETLDENTLDMEILEYNIPEAQIFTTDNNVFVITGNKIKKLGF